MAIEQKHVCCPSLQVILPRLPASAATAIFSRNFSHALVLNLRKPDNYLHAMAKRVMVREHMCVCRQRECVCVCVCGFEGTAHISEGRSRRGQQKDRLVGSAI